MRWTRYSGCTARRFWCCDTIGVFFRRGGGVDRIAPRLTASRVDKCALQVTEDREGLIGAMLRRKNVVNILSVSRAVALFIRLPSSG